MIDYANLAVGAFEEKAHPLTAVSKETICRHAVLQIRQERRAVQLYRTAYDLRSNGFGGVPCVAESFGYVQYAWCVAVTELLFK